MRLLSVKGWTRLKGGVFLPAVFVSAKAVSLAHHPICPVCSVCSGVPHQLSLTARTNFIGSTEARLSVDD